MNREKKRVISLDMGNENLSSVKSTIGTNGRVNRSNRKIAITNVKATGSKMTRPVMNDFFKAAPYEVE